MHSCPHVPEAFLVAKQGPCRPVWAAVCVISDLEEGQRDLSVSL